MSVSGLATKEFSASRHTQRRFVTLVSSLALLWCVMFSATLIGAVLWLGARDAAVRDAVPALVSAILVSSSVMVVPGLWIVWRVARHSRVDRMAADRINQPQPASLSWRRGTAEAASAWHAVMKDPLTGLFTRNALIEFSDDAVAYFKRYKRGVALLMVEIDTLPSANQARYSSTEDNFIRHIADILDLSVRNTDKVARFDDQRLIVLLREIGDQDLIVLANRICVSVSDLALKQGEDVIPLTVSIGAAVVCDLDAGSETLLNRAEKALALAKTAGGNRVVLMAATKEVAALDVAA